MHISHDFKVVLVARKWRVLWPSAGGGSVKRMALWRSVVKQVSVLWLCLGSVSTVAAAPAQSLASISEAAEHHLAEVMTQRYLDADVSVKVNPPDARLRLAACSMPLEPFMTPGNNRGRSVSVGVSCAAPKPWKVYLRAQLSIIQETVVASRSLARGEILAPTDLEIALVDSAATGDPAFTSVNELVGLEVVRAVTAGRPMRSKQVRAPQVVQRGDTIVLVAGTEAFEVRMAGKALSSGAIGESVNVQSNGRRQTLQGRVVGPGMVRMQ